MDGSDSFKIGRESSIFSDFSVEAAFAVLEAGAVASAKFFDAVTNVRLDRSRPV